MKLFAKNSQIEKMGSFQTICGLNYHLITKNYLNVSGLMKVEKILRNVVVCRFGKFNIKIEFNI
jgi:hypothetical protein